MTDTIIILAIIALTGFMSFIAGFIFCQWGYAEKARQSKAMEMWESVEWD